MHMTTEIHNNNNDDNNNYSVSQKSSPLKLFATFSLLVISFHFIYSVINN